MRVIFGILFLYTVSGSTENRYTDENQIYSSSTEFQKNKNSKVISNLSIGNSNDSYPRSIEYTTRQPESTTVTSRPWTTRYTTTNYPPSTPGQTWPTTRRPESTTVTSRPWTTGYPTTNYPPSTPGQTWPTTRQPESTTTMSPSIPTTSKPVPQSCSDVDPFEVIYLPHECICTKYYACNNGIAVLGECPAGLHFNYSIQDCDFPESAGCTLAPPAA